MKWIYLGIISFTTIIGTFLLPLLSRKCINYLHYINGFSGAIMFSTALMHLIPHIFENNFTTYPFPMLFIVISFYIIMFIEKILFHVHHHEVNISVKNEFIKNMLNILAIGLHALVAGITLGLMDTNKGLTQMFIAIISHKIFAAYAIGNKMFQAHNKIAIIIPLIFFNLMTPCGIIIGYYVSNINPWVNMVLTSVSTGAFLYIGCTDTLIDEIEMHHDHSNTTHTNDIYGISNSNLQPLEIEQVHNHYHPEHKSYNKLKLYFVQLFGVAIVALVNLTYLYVDH